MTSPTDPLAPFRAAASPEQRAEMTPDRLDDLERMAREASERASKATAGPWGHKAGVLKHYCFSTDEREDFGFSQQTLHWEDGHEVPAEANCIFVAHAREDVPALHGAVEELAAEVRRLRKRETRLTHERNALGQAILEAALKAGIYSGVPVTGPELILLVQEMAEALAKAWRLREEATRPAPRSPEEEEAMAIIRRAAESLRERDTVAARDRVVGMLMRHSFDGAANSLLEGESLSDVVAGLRYYSDKPGCDECITAVESLASTEPPRADEGSR